MKNKHNVTKQGVRDLNAIGGRKSKGRKLELPPPEAFMTPNDGFDSDVTWDESYEQRRTQMY